MEDVVNVKFGLSGCYASNHPVPSFLRATPPSKGGEKRLSLQRESRAVKVAVAFPLLLKEGWP